MADNELGPLSEAEKKAILDRRDKALSPEKLAQKQALDNERMRVSSEQDANYKAYADGDLERATYLQRAAKLEAQALAAQTAFNAFKIANPEPDDQGAPLRRRKPRPAVDPERAARRQAYKSANPDLPDA